jgi:excisionase family DNA binding protein
MLTVPEAARRLRLNPETIRRWIRSGRLTTQRVGTQHLIDEADLAKITAGDGLPLPPGWEKTVDGRPAPDFVRIIRRHRSDH